MICDEAARRMSDLELGELEAGAARELELHLRDCGRCRGERERTARVLGSLRSLTPAAPSTERRLAAVAAMTREAVAIPAPPRPRLVPLAAAAAFLLTLAGTLFLREPMEAFRAVSVDGRVDRFDRAAGEWKPLLASDSVRPGDRIVSQSGGRVRLEGAGGRLELEPETSLDVVGPRRITLDRGRLAAMRSPEEGAGLRITDTANNFVELKEGALLASLREVVALVAGSSERREGASRLPAARSQTVHRLSVRIVRGEADLGGSHDQRLRARAGQEGTFDFGGQPAAAPARE